MKTRALLRLKGVVQLLLDALGDEDGLHSSFKVLDEDGDSSRRAGRRCAGREVGLQARGDADEGWSPTGVAQSVVDDLEAVEVEVEHAYI